MKLGYIIKVEDANTYLAKIPPDAKKECIGRFVKIKKDEGKIIGIIKNIIHDIREDLIPYIEPQMNIKYAPFNEDFRNSYYSIHGLGMINNGIVKYNIDSPPDLRDDVEALDADEIISFHTINGKQSIAYFHSNAGLLPANVLLGMADQIEAGYPECKAMLNLVRKYIMRDK